MSADAGSFPDGVELTGDLLGAVRLGCVGVAPVEIAETSGDLELEIDQACRRVREEYEGLKPSEIPGLAPARELYRLFGIDPTKLRPSSESLLRRVLRQRPLPRISNAVDLCNLLAMTTHLPMGLYDAEKIDGPVHLARGAGFESYRGVRKEQVNLHGRPVLADRTGPFGNPTADSARTAVDRNTTRLWLVVFAPSSYPRQTMERQLQQARNSMMRHLGVEPTHSKLLVVD